MPLYSLDNELYRGLDLYQALVKASKLPFRDLEGLIRHLGAVSGLQGLIRPLRALQGPQEHCKALEGLNNRKKNTTLPSGAIVS